MLSVFPKKAEFRAEFGQIERGCLNDVLSLQVSAKGWDLRFFPFQLYHRHIGWDEIKNVCLIQNRELPCNAAIGFPA